VYIETRRCSITAHFGFDTATLQGTQPAFALEYNSALAHKVTVTFRSDRHLQPPGNLTELWLVTVAAWVLTLPLLEGV